MDQNDFFNNRKRIFTEYRLPCGRIADIAVVEVDLDKAKNNHLRDSVTSIDAIIEIKYKAYNVIEPFYMDIEKLVSYSRLYKDTSLFAAFIHEEYYSDDESSWLVDMGLHNGTNINELLGYWDAETDTFVTKVNMAN